MRRTGGFTLIELMIVVTVIAIIIAIAIPNLLASRLRANETSAVATLRSVSTAQAQFQASGAADTDGDGMGEFGMFRELSGGADVRDTADGSFSGTPGGNVLNPPILSGVFRQINALGEVSKSGYQYRIFLPAATGAGVSERPQSSVFANPHDQVFQTNVSAELCEVIWCAYAWPSRHDVSGSRTFFVNQQGVLVGTDQSLYSGPDGIQEASAGTAFQSGAGALTSITGQVAVGTVGREHGSRWKSVN